MSSEFSASNLVFLLIFFNGVEMVMFATYYCLVKKRNVVVINVLDDFFFLILPKILSKLCDVVYH